jgi:hypothetical protein
MASNYHKNVYEKLSPEEKQKEIDTLSILREYSKQFLKNNIIITKDNYDVDVDIEDYEYLKKHYRELYKYLGENSYDASHTHFEYEEYLNFYKKKYENVMIIEDLENKLEEDIDREDGFIEKCKIIKYENRFNRVVLNLDQKNIDISQFDNLDDNSSDIE